MDRFIEIPLTEEQAEEIWEKILLLVGEMIYPDLKSKYIFPVNDINAGFQEIDYREEKGNGFD